MSNVLTTIIRNINGPFMEILSEQAALPALVDTDFDTVPAALGQVIRTPITPILTGSARTNAAVPTLASGQTLTNADVTISVDWKVPFNLSGDDYLALESPTPTPGFVPNSLKEAIRVMRNKIASDSLANLVASASAGIGAAGSDPFTPPTAIAAILPYLAQGVQFLNDSLCPMTERNVILSTSALAQLNQNPILIKVNESGDSEMLRNGMIGRLEGIQVAYDQLIARPAVGTGSSYVLNGNVAVGASSIVLGTGSGTVLVGDLITIAGDPTIYVAGSALAAPGTLQLNVGTRPGYNNTGYIMQASTSGTAVTILAQGSRMPLFHRTAQKLVVRPSAMPPDGDQAVSSAIFQDEKTGLAMRLSYYKMYGINQWEVQAAYGFATVRPELVKVFIGK